MERCNGYEGLEVTLIDPARGAVPDNLRVLCRRCRVMDQEAGKDVPGPKPLRDDVVWKALELAGYRCQCRSDRGCHGPKSPKSLF